MCDSEGVFVLALPKREWLEFYSPISLSIFVSVCVCVEQGAKQDSWTWMRTHTDAHLIRNVY